MSLDKKVSDEDTRRLLMLEKHCEGIVIREQVLAPPHEYRLSEALQWQEKTCPTHYKIKQNYDGK